MAGALWCRLRNSGSSMFPSIINTSLRGPLRPRSKLLWSSHWLHNSYKQATLPLTRKSSTKATDEKPYYLTTPIFYVNAAPHVGHLYTMVLTDILKRWQVLKGRKAILCTGTDEHGMKIQQAAAKAGTEPGEFCNKGAETFKTLANRAQLSNDHFVRTTDPAHKEAVQHAWHLLKERGYIYESKHEGWYCVSDETFYPESTIEKRLDPFDGRTFMASSETGKEVEWTSERNYHFRLSAFRDKLLEFYKQNPEFIVPSSRMNDVVKWVTEGLEDLSVSRPTDRLQWGIRVPDDESQTIYVWLDALVNYVTKAGYPWSPDDVHAGGWPADVHVIGKDIVRFHCIYWPAFLMALELPLPKQILTHAHWTLGHQKMAKSTGNVVDPFFALKRYGVDAMRYYLAHDGGISNDSDYGNHFIVKEYKKGLQGGLGNLINRITMAKGWSVRESVELAAEGKLPTVMEGSSDPSWVQQKLIEGLRDEVDAKFVQLHPGQALKTIMNVVYETNKYFTAQAPWHLVKSEDPADKLRICQSVYHCAEAIRVVGILLQPYMPDKSAQLLDVIGVDATHRSYDNATWGSDFDYGTSKINLGRGSWAGLFPSLVLES